MFAVVLRVDGIVLVDVATVVVAGQFAEERLVVLVVVIAQCATHRCLFDAGARAARLATTGAARGLAGRLVDVFMARRLAVRVVTLRAGVRVVVARAGHAPSVGTRTRGTRRHRIARDGAAVTTRRITFAPSGIHGRLTRLVAGFAEFFGTRVRGQRRGSRAHVDALGAFGRCHRRRQLGGP